MEVLARTATGFTVTKANTATRLANQRRIKSITSSTSRYAPRQCYSGFSDKLVTDRHMLLRSIVYLCQLRCTPRKRYRQHSARVRHISTNAQIARGSRLAEGTSRQRAGGRSGRRVRSCRGHVGAGAPERDDGDARRASGPPSLYLRISATVRTLGGGHSPYPHAGRVFAVGAEHRRTSITPTDGLALRIGGHYRRRHGRHHRTRVLRTTRRERVSEQPRPRARTTL